MPVDAPVIDLTHVVERNKSDGDVIQISTAPGRGRNRAPYRASGRANRARGRTGSCSR